LTKFEISELYKKTFGYVASPFSHGEVEINTSSGRYEALNKEKNSFGGIHVAPLILDSFKFPIEPIISISGQTKIIRRHVAKSKSGGSIKERFSDDDFKISIKGILIGKDEFPEKDLSQLIALCRKKTHIEAESPLLSIYGIYHLVINSFNFPYTPGENIQSYSISAYSDELFDSLLEEE
jgi:hypothetical protein